MSGILTTETTLGALVAEDPGRAELLESLGLDYCCGGGRSVGDACAQAGLDPQAVLRLLAAAPGGTERRAEVDIRALSLAELADHIEATHHRRLRADLPRVNALAAKVLAAHGTRHPELAELAQVLADLSEELMAHMNKEERILFPAVRGIERSGRPANVCFLSIAQPIGVMEAEHEAAGRALGRLRALSAGYEAPADACESYRALYAALGEIEQDLHVHIHKENNELFRRARDLELGARRGG